MKMFVNTTGVPVNTAKPKLDGRIVGGDQIDISSHPYKVWPLRRCSIWRLVWSIWTKETACVCNDNILVVKTY
jgi:hypothetical protein